ncbi:hypothetical protein EII34_05805 [Arachnia propionica]|uniref:Polysaccharide chain length determinant N-terminal domain-containing protein n=1 Tax=Arachnia propionica TaxID=1750 RepID=A0A3P1T8F4_9ACTN|nr:Wzz/FepE/Etk N-terminal domain-containing protein [Arachnia propionica]MDO5084710.1 Wzz/FepE/Etk N-terminal domain-containing protein [Arachnia propionica]RRD05724.1 hypothetical protein EII34_05805 [Arachnia propionica]
MNLRDLTSVFVRHWLLLVGCALAGGVLGATLGIGATPSYTATSRVSVVAVGVTDAEEAGRITTMVRSEMTLYQALAASTPVAERVASRIQGAIPEQVSGSVVASAAEQLLVVRVTQDDPMLARRVAELVAEEVALEIAELHPVDPPIIQARPIDVPVVVSSDNFSTRTLVVAGASLGLVAGLALVGLLAAFRPVVGSGAGLVGMKGVHVMRARPNALATQQLAAVLGQRIDTAGGAVALVGSGSRVNLGPWSQGVTEALGPRLDSMTVSADGQDGDLVAAVAHGAVTALVVNPRDQLSKVREQAALLAATGADLAALVVVNEPRS